MGMTGGLYLQNGGIIAFVPDDGPKRGVAVQWAVQGTEEINDHHCKHFVNDRGVINFVDPQGRWYFHWHDTWWVWKETTYHQISEEEQFQRIELKERTWQEGEIRGHPFIAPDGECWWRHEAGWWKWLRKTGSWKHVKQVEQLEPPWSKRCRRVRSIQDLIECGHNLMHHGKWVEAMQMFYRVNEILDESCKSLQEQATGASDSCKRQVNIARTDNLVQATGPAGPADHEVVGIMGCKVEKHTPSVADSVEDDQSWGHWKDWGHDGGTRDDEDAEAMSVISCTRSELELIEEDGAPSHDLRFPDNDAAEANPYEKDRLKKLRESTEKNEKNRRKKLRESTEKKIEEDRKRKAEGQPNQYGSFNGWKQKKILELCRYYNQGQCNRGENCIFSHDTALQVRGEWTPKDKTQCKFFVNHNWCKHGEKCEFSHAVSSRTKGYERGQWISTLLHDS
jgi:hypothetical protein